MNTDVSAHALLEVLRRYYPSGPMPRMTQLEASAEAQRLRRRIDSFSGDTRAWSFVQQVKAAFPGCDVSYSYPMGFTPSLRCHVTLPGMQPKEERTEEGSVTGMISVLAPVYALYARHWRDDRTERDSWQRYPPLPAEYQAHEAKLAALIESSFGATRVPNEVLFTHARDLLAHEPPHRDRWLAELLF